MYSRAIVRLSVHLDGRAMSFVIKHCEKQMFGKQESTALYCVCGILVVGNTYRFKSVALYLHCNYYDIDHSMATRILHIY
jgi:hypothetical protein